MYKTKEEVEQAFPLGTVIAETPMFQRFYCADDIMFDKIKAWFNDAQVEQTSPHHATVTRMVTKTVEGYLYDGDNWYPMIHEGMNWAVYIPETF